MADFCPIWFCFSSFTIFSLFSSFTCGKWAPFFSQPSPKKRDALPEPGSSCCCRWSLQLFNVDFFSDPRREISHPPPLLSPQNAPHIALGPHLRPPFLGVPSALCQTPGECRRCLRSAREVGRVTVLAVASCPLAQARFLCFPALFWLPCSDGSRLPSSFTAPPPSLAPCFSTGLGMSCVLEALLLSPLESSPRVSRESMLG